MSPGSVSLDTPGAIVFKSSGANGNTISLVAPPSLAASFSTVVGPNVVDIAQGVNTTLNVAQSGALVRVVGGAANAITLPPAATSAGIKYEFVLTSNGAGGSISIIAGGVNSNRAKGLVTRGDATVVVGGNTNNCNFTATALVGDHISCVCDGTNWNFTGISAAAAGATFTNA